MIISPKKRTTGTVLQNIDQIHLRLCTGRIHQCYLWRQSLSTLLLPFTSTQLKAHFQSRKDTLLYQSYFSSVLNVNKGVLRNFELLL